MWCPHFSLGKIEYTEDSWDREACAKVYLRTSSLPPLSDPSWSLLNIYLQLRLCEGEKYRRNLVLVQRFGTKVTQRSLSWCGCTPEGKGSWSRDSLARLLCKCLTSICTFVMKWTWQPVALKVFPFAVSHSLHHRYQLFIHFLTYCVVSGLPHMMNNLEYGVGMEHGNDLND